MNNSNKRFRVAVVLICLFVFPVFCNSQQIVNGKPVTKKTDNRTLLNLWGEQPELIRNLYDAAYNVFSLNSEAKYSDLASDKTVKRILEDNNIVHYGGPMLGQISPEGVSVWLRTVKPSTVEIRIGIEGKDMKFGPAFSSDKTDLSATVSIKGLKPETEYNYKVFVDGKEIVPANSSFTFHTPSENKERVTGRIAFGSCFHRWGIGNLKQADMILSRKPDAILFNGDVAVQDRMNNSGLHRADYLLRDFIPAWQKLVATIPAYDTWDDHDYFNDDLAGIPKGFTLADKEKVWNIYRYAWNNPAYGFGENNKGVFYRTRVGPADIIMVDERYFRTGEKGSFLGKEQMEWLKKNLLECKGPFIILSCGTMWSDYVDDGKDSWGVNDPEGRENLFSFIEKNNIKGVLLISGDRHGARGFTIPRSSGFNFYEFEAASLGGRVGPSAIDSLWKTQMYGISGKFAFGEFSFGGSKADPEVIFRLWCDDGTMVFEKRLLRSQLTPSNFNGLKNN
jgi:alkaline phosphatase D